MSTTGAQSSPATHASSSNTHLQTKLNPLAALRAVWSPDNGLTSSEAAVLCVLIMHANAEGKCWPGQARIARCAKLKNTALNRILKRLEEKQLIQRASGRFVGTSYQLIASAINALIPTPLKEDDGDISSPLKGDVSPLKEDDTTPLKGDKLLNDELLKGTNSPPTPSKHQREKAEREKNQSQYSYEDCERYAASLKGIRSPGAFARTIHRNGEADKQITGFLAEEARRAAKKAEEEAGKRADLIQMAEEIKANGGPQHEWERRLVETAASYAAAPGI